MTRKKYSKEFKLDAISLVVGMFFKLNSFFVSKANREWWRTFIVNVFSHGFALCFFRGGAMGRDYRPMPLTGGSRHLTLMHPENWVFWIPSQDAT